FWSPLKDDNWFVRGRAIDFLSELSKHEGLEKFHPLIAPAMSRILESLKDDEWYIREAAINCLSELAKYEGLEKLHALIASALSRILESLKDEDEDNRRAATNLMKLPNALLIIQFTIPGAFHELLNGHGNKKTNDHESKQLSGDGGGNGKHISFTVT
ncbi:hypothetical protein BT96DRAFT_949310, partial [Gymnopus androsaceus JB14]